MFVFNTKPTSLEFGANFDTSNVENMSYMFNVMTALTSLNIKYFDFSEKLTDYNDMLTNV